MRGDALRARQLATPFALHDVRDVEAHVGALADAKLALWGAHLDESRYSALLAYLLETCWELSGLTPDGGHRIVWWGRARTGGETRLIGPGVDAAEMHAIAERYCARHTGALVEVFEGPPRGAYDRTLGLSFSTYSRRILSRRVVDWYRAEFGDTRYGPARHDLSLEGVLERREAVGEAPEQFLDMTTGPADDPYTRVFTDAWAAALTG